MKNELTKKEIETVKSLIRLGDSEEVAIKTVLNERNNSKDSDIYRIAYES